MFKFGMRTSLITSFLILIVLMMSALGSYMLWFLHQYNIDRLTANLQAEAEMAEHLLRPYMSGPIQKAGLDSILKELAFKAELRLTIIDPSGTVLADSWENPALMENHLNRPEIMSALGGEVGKATRYSTTLSENLLYIAIPMKQENEITGVLRASTTLAHVEAVFNEIRTFLFLSFLLTSFLAIILSIRLARKYTAPIEEITELAKQMGTGLLDKRVHLRTGDELEVLGHTLNNLASSLDEKMNEIIAEKRKLELVFENMDNAVILFDRYGRVIDANKRAQNIFTITSSMYGQHQVQAIGTGLLDRALKETMQQGTSQQIDLKLSIQGVKRVFQVFLAPTNRLDNGSVGILAVFHDVTALKEVEERQTDFVANASHELATPLTSIKGFVETLLDGAVHNPELSIKFLKIIQEDAERMDRLLKDLLQLARISSSDFRQRMRLDSASIHETAKTVVRQLSSQLEAKSLSVELAEPSTEFCIRTNPDWLNQILSNLLENSIKFTPPGGKILIKCWQEQDKAIIAVTDTGIGIPAQELPFIFDRFYRVDRARARTAGGTGLGLAIVKFMAETLGGRIDAQSKVDVGSTFIVTLPIK